MTRIYHTWEKWECYPAGFYDKKPKRKLTEDECKEEYRQLLQDTEQFEAALEGVISNWKFSCEHYLTNEKMNRIAWLGQASLCYAKGIPSIFRGGFNRLSDDEQMQANVTALKYLNIWLTRNGLSEITWEEAQSKTEANIY